MLNAIMAMNKKPNPRVKMKPHGDGKKEATGKASEQILIYLKLNEVGTVPEIVRLRKTPECSTYTAMNHLLEKGIVRKEYIKKIKSNKYTLADSDITSEEITAIKEELIAFANRPSSRNTSGIVGVYPLKSGSFKSLREGKYYTHKTLLDACCHRLSKTA